MKRAVGRYYAISFSLSVEVVVDVLTSFLTVSGLFRSVAEELLILENLRQYPLVIEVNRELPNGLCLR